MSQPAFTGNTPTRYHFLRDLASGGMGRVELAVREEGAFRRVYAVKRLRPEFRSDPEIRAMFVEEARVAGLLNHPNVVGVIDVGEDEDGPFLVMDFVEGMTASALLHWAQAQSKVLSVQLCVRVIRGIAEGLHAAHELTNAEGSPLHVVHRDVSPQNILLGYDGSIRLTDFGVAKALGRAHRTNTGVLKGKFGYMSPEQLQFEPPDRRSDLFSLGIVFYELLSGSRLYRSKDPAESARRILKEDPPDIDEVRSDVHPGIVELLFALLTRDRDHRPADARVVARKLDEVLADLVSVEGSIELSDFMDTHFAADREQVRTNLLQIRTAPLSSLTARSRRKRRRGLTLGLAALSVAAVPLGIWGVASVLEPAPAPAVSTVESDVPELEVVLPETTEESSELNAETPTVVEPAATEPRRVKRATSPRRRQPVSPMERPEMTIDPSVRAVGYLPEFEP